MLAGFGAVVVFVGVVMLASRRPAESDRQIARADPARTVRRSADRGLQAVTGAKTRSSLRAVRIDHVMVNTIAVTVIARLTKPFSATNVVVGRLTRSRNMVPA